MNNAIYRRVTACLIPYGSSLHSRLRLYRYSKLIFCRSRLALR